MQKWQHGIIYLAFGGFLAYLTWDLYGYSPLWQTDLSVLFTLLTLGGGVWDLLAPATMFVCPKCGIRTRHYPVKDRHQPNRRMFKCDVCGNKGVVSPPKPKPSESAAQKPKGFCINCGKELVTDSKFCPECGATQLHENAETKA